MDLSDLLDLIYTSEDDLRRLGAQGGPEARQLVDQAVAATRKAREEAEAAFGKVFEKAGLCRRSELDALAKKVEELTARVHELEARGPAPRPAP
jgi:polyhydroxyalkanoate synthesis regulator phasin